MLVKWVHRRALKTTEQTVFSLAGLRDGKPLTEFYRISEKIEVMYKVQRNIFNIKAKARNILLSILRRIFYYD